jgi:hypothetical protein
MSRLMGVLVDCKGIQSGWGREGRKVERPSNYVQSCGDCMIV